MPLPSPASLYANTSLPSKEALALLLRRAEAELEAGHFSEVMTALRPHGGMGSETVDSLLGFALTGLDQHEEAALCLLSAFHLGEGSKHPALELVALFSRLNRREQARKSLEALLRITPNDARVLDAMGELLIYLGDIDEALSVLDHSLDIRPVSPLTMNFKAIALMEKGELTEATNIFRKVLELIPHNASALSNLACIYSAINRSDDALALYRSAVIERPQNATIRLNHSISLLKAGRYAQGWAEHEWRLQLPGHSQLPVSRLLPSLGDGVDIRGKRILVTQEEGLGDTLMYLRYIPALARRGAIVHLWVPETLADLCRRVEGAAIVQFGGSVPEFDWHCPFISLPRAFVGTEDAMGDPVPYLRTDPQKDLAARTLLPDNGRLNVGLVWGGEPRPNLSSALMLDRKRSTSLASLDPLGKIAGINLISFQKGAHAEQGTTLPCGRDILDLMVHAETMDDTASFLMGIDVLVSVDTSVVHLAGALGRPVLLMDRFDNCWRWLSGREDSIWYPDLKIIRQKKPKKWDDVIKRVASELRKMAAAHKAS
ncbi:tetratricopeptide repeat protein [Acetobacter sp.]|uniref:tetratricopeptide repeat-containing glycosyltransferase family protein n=1 Tax=Acetobacter sp. TaxID=440 RepID=UPI0025BB7ADD|nr:tetratricopeptide repeat protein [Acetobacter sp.]MCH4090444.1 tetratricopeptide repeat protein [Acetobacter sp.]MCI1299138.1 tetratricopeptide repeat protein [Acetobacter sp.]MCI1315685.1 tetratricopeptide repeat protein [Acetobacter sp.]